MDQTAHKEKSRWRNVYVSLISVFFLLLFPAFQNIHTRSESRKNTQSPNALAVRHTRNVLSDKSLIQQNHADYKTQEDIFKPGDWEKQQLAAMSLDQKIAQLMMIEVRPTLGVKHLQEVRTQVQQYQVGGLIFFKGDPIQQALLTNELQAMSKVPMMIAIDGEWGLSMRLSNTPEYPYQLALGAIQNEELLYEMGREIGRNCRRMGIHVNFAPVADVNNNPRNPVINYRSFGEQTMAVARKSWLYARGMQDEKIIACAKHFPGHGDTEVDSHKDLPVILHDRAHLDTVELAPFRYLFDRGIKSVMTAHLHIPAIDTTSNRSISLSPQGIEQLLRKDMAYTGLSFTDALNMKGVSKFYQPGQLELQAFIAGNDILLGPENVALSIQTIHQAVDSGIISEEEINRRVLKILAAKKWNGLDRYSPIDTNGLYEDLNSTKALALRSRLIEESLIYIGDPGRIPLQKTSTKTALLALGTSEPTLFQKSLLHHLEADLHVLSKNATAEEQISCVTKMKGYERVVISLHGLNKQSTRSYGLSSNTMDMLQSIAQVSSTVLVYFGNPYGLEFLLPQSAVLVAYDNEDVYQQKAAMALSGHIKVNGRLPVSVGPLKAGYGENILPMNEFALAVPEEKGLSSSDLRKIDSIVNKAISAKATPGAQVLVAYKGKVIFTGSYGTLTYESNSTAVMPDHLYDLASITKILATTLAVMKLTEEGKMKPDDKLSTYLPELKGGPKAAITISQVLRHKAGFKAWLPFYTESLKDSNVYRQTYSSERKEPFVIEVGKNLYMNKNQIPVVLNTIYKTPLETPGKYVYSDWGMILLRYAIEKASGMPLESYVQKHFYGPMGLNRIGFLPLQRFPESRTVPTEMGRDFRKDLIQGYVHDPAAAMLGGVSGHAGLFSNSQDVAALMQMLLNKGMYNGRRYLKAETIVKFTRKQDSDSRRGLGFDKPDFIKPELSAVSANASASSFGHTGFTGTLAWADPENELVFVFLSNRIHPSSDNKKLIQDNVRIAIMDVIYEAIFNTEQKE